LVSQNPSSGLYTVLCSFVKFLGVKTSVVALSNTPTLQFCFSTRVPTPLDLRLLLPWESLKLKYKDFTSRFPFSRGCFSRRPTGLWLTRVPSGRYFCGGREQPRFPLRLCHVTPPPFSSVFYTAPRAPVLFFFTVVSGGESFVVDRPTCTLPYWRFFGRPKLSPDVSFEPRPRVATHPPFPDRGFGLCTRLVSTRVSSPVCCFRTSETKWSGVCCRWEHP